MRRLVLLLALAACVVVPAAQERRRPNLLLITIDTFRADRLTPKLTPTLWALAERGARVERTYTHAPLTLPAHASLFTGLLPPSHGVRNNGFRLDDEVVTLAEVLRGAGYRTGAFVGGSALDARFGLAQGFERYDERYDLVQGPSGSSAFRNGAGSGTGVLTATAGWITQQSEAWFAWSHLRDPHAPYVAYDRAVTTVDAAVEAFLSPLAKLGVLDRTIVVVTADHGESLGEHGERTHGVFAYEGVLRVPLVIAGPGIAPGVVQGTASLVDVMPTVLDLLGITPPVSDGASLSARLRGAEAGERTVYFEALDAALMRGGAPLTGIVSGRWKYIDLPVPELYDVVGDPAELQNRAPAETAMATQLRDVTIRLRTSSPRADAAAMEAEPQARARLRSLGYVGSSSWRLGTSRVEDDPKRLLPLHLAYEGALEMAGSDPEGAIRQLDLIVQQRPDFAAAIDAMGALLIAQGQPAKAVTVLSEARAGGLRHRALAERLAAALLAARDARGAVTVLEPVVAADSAAADARFLLARAYSAIGKGSAAVEQLQETLRIDPSFEAASTMLARLQKQ